VIFSGFGENKKKSELREGAVLGGWG